MKLCSYYQAHVKQDACWFFVATLRSYEHLCFDRTYDVERSIFEFFVPTEQEEVFVAFMQDMERRGVVSQFHKLPNRLTDAQEGV